MLTCAVQCDDVAVVLTGHYAVEEVAGAQEKDKNGHPKMITFLKHFTAYVTTLSTQPIHFVLVLTMGSTPSMFSRVGSKLRLPIHADVHNIDDSSHFFRYSMESDRMHSEPIVSAFDLHDSYLPQYVTTPTRHPLRGGGSNVRGRTLPLSSAVS